MAFASLPAIAPGDERLQLLVYDAPAKLRVLRACAIAFERQDPYAALKTDDFFQHARFALSRLALPIFRAAKLHRSPSNRIVFEKTRQIVIVLNRIVRVVHVPRVALMRLFVGSLLP